MKKSAALLLTGVLLGSGSFLSAQSVSSAGSVLNETEWVTNGFGSVAYSFFAVNGSNTNLLGGELSGGYISLGLSTAADSNPSEGTPLAIQNTAGTATDLNVGNIFNFGLDASVSDNATFTFGAGTANSLRIGVLVGVLEAADGGTDPFDIPGSIQIGISGGNTISQTTVQPSSQQADWYFFDLAGISDGTVVTVSSTRVADQPEHRFNPINGVAFSVIPEPGALGLLSGVLALAVTQLRRRKHVEA